MAAKKPSPKRKVGRPVDPNARRARVSFRLTDKELRAAKAAAKRAGLGFGEWCRRAFEFSAIATL